MSIRSGSVCLTVVALLAVLGSAPATAVPIDALAVINGGDFLQSFTVTNQSTTGLNIVEIVYSHGTPTAGHATWDTGVGGGVASDFLSNPEWFQTVTWSGLNVAPGASFSIPSFSLDIDLIASLLPLSIDQGTIDNVGSSLAGSYIGVRYDNGVFASANLNQTGWTVD